MSEKARMPSTEWYIVMGILEVTRHGLIIETAASIQTGIRCDGFPEVFNDNPRWQEQRKCEYNNPEYPNHFHGQNDLSVVLIHREH